MKRQLDLLHQLDRGDHAAIDRAQAADPTTARQLFLALRHRAQARELDEALARLTPGPQAKLRLRPLAQALQLLSGLSEIILPEAVAVRDARSEAPPVDRVFYGPFELRAGGAGKLILVVPAGFGPLALFRDDRPWSLIDDPRSQWVELPPGQYRLEREAEAWELTVEG